MLQDGVKVNPMMALNRCGCFRLAAIIKLLRIYDLSEFDTKNLKTNKALIAGVKFQKKSVDLAGEQHIPVVRFNSSRRQFRSPILRLS